MTKLKLAVLDDYQGTAKDLGDWSSLPPGTTVQFFQDHIADEDKLVERLKGFDMVMGMRERTPFTRTILSRLPKLRLLITTGLRNASFDMDAASDLGIPVCGAEEPAKDPPSLPGA